MKTRTILFSLLIVIISFNCSKNVEYTSEFMEQTSGKYLYNPDDVLEVYYKDEKLFLKWRGAEKIEPVVLDKNTFFVVDMYKKLRFVQHPDTKDRYLSILSEKENDVVTYDYLKVSDTFNTPSMYLKKGDYKKALIGYLEIKKKDSTSVLIREREFNSRGYRFLRDKEYQDAIEIFKMNVALHPNSDNVYDSLADAYLISGDSLQALNNYKKALELNSSNRRAKKYIEGYNKKQY